MAGQSITFDFLTRGADILARDLKNVGDTSAAAARGAAVLSRIIKDLGDKENRTAEESRLLASALKKTGDAEDNMAAKAVLADASIRKLDDQMQSATKSAVSHEAALKRVGNVFKNLGTGGGLFAAGAAGLALSGPFAGATAAISAFGALAIPVFSKVTKAQQALTTAQQAYEAATTKAQRQTALKAEKKATEDLTASEKGLMGPLAELGKLWRQMGDQIAPVLVSLVKFGVTVLKAVRLPLENLAQVGGQALEALLKPLGRFLGSKVFSELAAGLASLAYQAAAVAGPALTQLLKVFLQLFVQVGPAGIKLLRALLPAIVELVTDLTPAIVAIADVTAAVVGWLSKNHLLIPALGVAAAAVIAFTVALDTNPIFLMVSALAVLVAAITYMAKHWSQVWASIKSIAADAWHFISDGWHKYLFLGLYAIISAAIYVVKHWQGAWRDIRAAVSDAWTFMRVQFDRMELLFLEWAKTLVHAAADAFGWIPGLGGKLKAADRALGSFVSSTEARLYGLTHKSYMIRFGVDLPSGVAGISGKTTTAPRAAAAGWLVPGTGNADTVPAMLTPGEAVVPKRLVPSVAPFLKAGGVPGFAAGGVAGGGSPGPGVLTVHLSTPSIAAMARTLGSTVAAIVGYVQSHARPAGGFGGFFDTGARSGSAAIAQAFARAILPAGWSWPALAALWNRESGWNAYAVNPSSGAYGIPQALGHGHPYNLGDYKAQILWGLPYISGRYGSSQAAWAHEEAFGWYDRGGYLPPGLSLAYNGTGRPEPVIPHGRGAGGVTNVYLTVQVGHGTHPVSAAQELVKLLNEGAKSGVRLRSSILGPG